MFLNEYANLLVDIDLPSNIQSLHIFNDQDQDHIRLTTSTSSQNIGLTSIHSLAYIELESNDFFTHYTGLKFIDMRAVLSREPPSFSNLVSLTYLRIDLVGPVTHALDGGIVSGLTNLITLYFHESYFNGINTGALNGSMTKLKYLSFAKNN